MFTGIITDIGEVISFDKRASVWVLKLSTRFNTKNIAIGASVACNGVCLTVIEKEDSILSFDLSPETVSLTSFKDVKQGDNINLERSLKVGDELGGHYVSGHIDGVAEVQGLEKDGDNWMVTFKTKSDLAKYIAKKGSVCLNGVSLTVNNVDGEKFVVNIIPHTLKNTNLGELDTGKLVNLEVDIFARYIERMNNYKNA